MYQVFLATYFGTVILSAMSNYFLSYMQIIGQWPMPNGNPAKTRNGKLVALA
jgi:hypothetical protein